MKNKFPKITLQHFINLKEKKKLKEYFHKIFSLGKEPKNFAFSVAVGVFIGLFIPMGLQTIFIVPIAILLGCNVIIAWIFTFVSNPITIIPIYLFTFKIGELITSLEISSTKLNLVLSKFNFENFWDLGKEGLIIFLSGSFAIAFLSAVAAYFISLSLIKIYNRKYLK